MSDQFSNVKILDICQDLIALWKTRKDSEMRYRDRRTNPGLMKFLSVHGLVAHTYRVGEQALTMCTSGATLEAMPLIRMSYESALTSHWIAQNIDGAEALLNRDVHSREIAIRTLLNARSEVLRSGAQDFPAADAELLRTSSKAQARNFEQLCRDLEPGGVDAYAYYRLMSWYSHPSSRIIDSYVVPTEDRQNISALRLEPAETDTIMWVHFLAYSFVWAGRAVDFVDADRTHRNKLRDAARTLGIAEVLKLSDKAKLRTAKAEKEERRANWKSPRQKDSNESP
ncbi:DUF5677 domain-containing protein [Amycolatopsis mediterranei]|uniref:DUF5677 domain-containing protein n=1 Tax=Amycolatopsis mediterranei TaxID=33910 RepID=UPI00114CCDA4|nr:DUF5677 domain-containing protein [Amycolatopsis mediterranei]UZF72659.1 DUF5677 domain-containing protein [Amycolatopsis mediterranei]